MKKLVLALTLVFPSCLATSGDLREVSDKVAQWETGAITDDDLAKAIDSKAAEIERRAEEQVKNLPKTPMEIALWIAGIMATAAGASYRTVMSKRDAARRRRGEPI
jgi:uncharacterized protein (DUF885 family)